MPQLRIEEFLSQSTWLLILFFILLILFKFLFIPKQLQLLFLQLRS